jgi:hypothetical protein
MQRREFLLSASALASAWAWLDPGRAWAQGVSNVVARQGDVLVNGRTLARDGAIQTGDTVATGPGASVAFSIGNDAFLLRPGTTLALERGATLFAVAGARVLTGAFAAVFGRSARPRAITTPTLTAGIRGTGFYIAVSPASNYVCTCYGSIELTALGGEREIVNSTRHAARRIAAAPASGPAIVPAPFENHEDAEIERLAALVGQRAAWQR